MAQQYSCHTIVQNFVAITQLQLGCRHNEIPIKFELWWKNCSCNGPLIYVLPLQWPCCMQDITLQWRRNECDGISNHQPEILYSTVYSGADQRKGQNSTSLALVRGIHRSPVNSPHKGPVTREMFPFDDVIMVISCAYNYTNLYYLSML